MCLQRDSVHVEETLSHASLFVLGVCKAQQFEHEVDRSEEAGWGKEGEGGGISHWREYLPLLHSLGPQFSPSMP